MKEKVKKVKLIAFVLAIVTFWLIGAPITTNSILDRAIIVGLSIDFTDEQKFKLGAQIIYPTGATSTKSGSKANLVVAEGATISDALNSISEITGLFASLSHCNIIMLGQKIFDGKLEEALAFMIRYDSLSNNSLLTVVMGEASDVLKAKTDFTMSTSTYVLKEIVKNETYSGLGSVTIKDFYRNYYSETKINFMSVIKTIDPETGKEIKKAKPAANANESTDGSGTQEKEKKVIFDATTLAIIQKDKIALELDYNQSLIVDYIMFKEHKGSMSYISDIGTYEIEITRKNLKKKLSLEDMSIDYELNLKVILSEFTLKKEITDPSILAKMDEMDKEENAKIERTKEKEIEDLFKLCAEKKIDLFDLYGSFYRKYGKRFSENPDGDYLKNIKFKAKVTIKFV